MKCQSFLDVVSCEISVLPNVLSSFLCGCLGALVVLDNRLETWLTTFIGECESLFDERFSDVDLLVSTVKVDLKFGIFGEN